MALHIRYRPQTLNDFVGNESTVNSLNDMLNREAEDLVHAFLFTGPSGCGKTTLARIARERLGCEDADYVEVDAADFRGIESVREIRRQMNLAPMSGSCRVWLLDECHKMTNDAQNALLKALEDTPKHVYFLLATTDPHKLLKTIRNRCSLFAVQALSDRKITGALRSITRKEGKKINIKVLERIGMDCLGSMRSALVILDKIINLNPEDQLKAIETAAAEENEAIELCRALIKRQGWSSISKIIKGLTVQDGEAIRRVVLGYCNSVLLSKDNNRAYLIMDSFREPLYDINMPGVTMACYEVCVLHK